MATIQLLLEDDRNRELLAEALDEDYDLRSGVTDRETLLAGEFDLCLLDWRAFQAHRDLLADVKAGTDPVFLPYLLLLGEQRPSQTPGAVWERVDEVIETPVGRAELTGRIANLLKRRDLSLELDRRRAFSEERFRTLFDSTPDPIVVVTNDGTITEVNDAFVRMFDVDPDAVRGEAITEIETAPSEPTERLLLRVEEPHADAFADADATGSADTLAIASGTDDPYVTELNVDVVESLGDATERIGIFRDVTARETYREDLERKIGQLERFASVISHDLRDPLNTAQAKLRLAQRECDSEKLTELAEIHDRMATLVEDVLTLAKQGQAIGETESIDLAAVIDVAWATVDPPDSARVDPPSDPAFVEADEERLRTLFENLFGNAVTHAGPDVTVTVGLLPDRPGFYVADDGPGIPTAERDAVLEYGHSTRSGGTGFGLAIVDEIADAHGWAVTVTDATDGGARFEFTGVSCSR